MREIEREIEREKERERKKEREFSLLYKTTVEIKKC